MDKEKDRLISTLKEFKENANRKARLEKMVLFGSRATGKAKKASDVDLLLVSNDFRGKKFFKRSPPFYLMWDYEYDVDIICLTPSELIRKQKQIGIIREAVQKGIEV